MKKILGLLSVLTLSATTVSAVVACGYGNNKNNGESEESEDLRNLQVSFVADVKKIVQDHLQQNQENLLIKYSDESNKEFFDYQKIKGLTEERSENGVELTLSDEDYTIFKKELDGLLFLSQDLVQAVDSQLREVKEYEFLLVNIDKIINSITIGNKLIIKSVLPEGADEEYGYNFSVMFDLAIGFHFMWNEAEESQEISGFDLGFQMLSKEVSETNIIDSIKLVAENVYKDYSDFFHFTDEKLGTTLNLFSSQVNSVNTWFSKTLESAEKSNEELLAEYVQASVEQSVQSEDVQVSFDTKGYATGKNLYERTVTVTPKTEGWIDMALFGKNSEKFASMSSEEKMAALSSETNGVVDEANFPKAEKDSIKNIYKVDVKDDDKFSLYGGIVLQNSAIVFKGAEITINPIVLLYTYRSTKKTFTDAASIYFSSLREAWGMSVPDDKFAIFKLSSTTPLGQAFWASSNNLEKPFDFAMTNDGKAAYLKSSWLSDSGLHYFYFGTDNGRTTSVYPKTDDKGFSVNYWSYADKLEGNETEVERSFRFAVTFGTLTFSIRYALNPDYFNNVWVGSGTGNGGSTKYIIEKG